MKRVNILIVLFFISSVSAIFAYKFNSENENEIKNKERIIINVPIDNCNPQKEACKVHNDAINVGISLDENVYYLKPFQVSVWTLSKDDTDVESVQIDFKMKGMNMGVNRFFLTKLNSRNDQQNWRGHALLPICVTGRADWFAELEVNTEKSNYIYTIPVLVKQASH